MTTQRTSRLATMKTTINLLRYVFLRSDFSLRNCEQSSLLFSVLYIYVFFFSSLSALACRRSQDEDELRGALRILEALECCAWTPASSDSQPSVDNNISILSAQPIDDTSISTLGSKSLYAVPLLQERNRLDDQDGDVFDDDEMNLIDICNGVYPPTKPAGSTKSEKGSSEVDNLNGIESLMDKLSVFREKMGSMDHETRRKTADSMLMNMMELFDFQDEDEDDNETNTKNENEEYDQLEI